MSHHIICKCKSHIGNVRSINQDNYVLNGEYMQNLLRVSQSPAQGTVDLTPPFIAGVFDGMGGEEYGEIASRIAAGKASELVLSKHPANDLLRFCYSANDEICQYTAENGLTAMGTTAAMLCFAKRRIVLCNIGDSKVFSITRRKIEQISMDHKAAAAYGCKPAIFQYLGIPSEESRIEPYFAKGRYVRNSNYLICSDGLTDMVSLEKIQEIVLNFPVDTAVEELVTAALAGGGKDNITVILCRIV